MSFGSDADMSTFGGAVGAASIYGGTGSDTFDFADAVGGATIDLGAGADSLVFSSAVAGATISESTDTAGDVALLTSTKTRLFSRLSEPVLR